MSWLEIPEHSRRGIRRVFFLLGCSGVLVLATKLAAGTLVEADVLRLLLVLFVLLSLSAIRPLARWRGLPRDIRTVGAIAVAAGGMAVVVAATSPGPVTAGVVRDAETRLVVVGLSSLLYAWFAASALRAVARSETAGP